MEIQKQCDCCLQRPPARDLRTPFTHLGVTESYSIMMEECLAIQLLLDNDCEHGICLECVDQLRGACNFKLQVLQCQAKLRERWGWQQHVKEEEAPVLVAAVTCDNDEFLLGEEPHMQPDCEDNDPESDGGPAQVFCEEPDMQPECVGGDPESDAGPAQVFPEINADKANAEVVNTENDAVVLEEENTEDVNRLEKQSEVLTSDEDDFNLVYSDDEPIEFENSTETPPVPPNKDALCEQPSLSEEPDMQLECVGDDPESDAGPAQVFQGEEPALSVSARAREQLAARGSVSARLERRRVHAAGGGALGGTQIYSCQQCGRFFRSKSVFRIHTDGKCRWKSNLQDHMTTHTREKSFKCGHCEYKCSRNANLQRHLEAHTGLKRFQCSDCNYKSDRKRILKRHRKIHTGEKPFQCDHCDYRSCRKINLQRHLMIHTGKKPFQCDHCDYRSCRKINLQRHLMIHTGKKPFQCDHCDYRCSQKTYLQSHLMIHTGKKPFQCDHCDYRCRQKTNLQRHLEAHTGLKRFQCSDCNYKSDRKSSLKRHRKMHTGENFSVTTVITEVVGK